MPMPVTGSNPGVWHEFVNGNNLRNRSLSEYYQILADENGEVTDHGAHH